MTVPDDSRNSAIQYGHTFTSDEIEVNNRDRLVGKFLRAGFLLRAVRPADESRAAAPVMAETDHLNFLWQAQPDSGDLFDHNGFVWPRWLEIAVSKREETIRKSSWSARSRGGRPISLHCLLTFL